MPDPSIRRDRISDEMTHDRRPHAVLVDRSRRDVHSWIHPDAIEAFSFMEIEAHRLQRVFDNPPSWRRHGRQSSQWLLDYLDENLIKAMNRRGWRAEQSTSVLRGPSDGDNQGTRDIESASLRGLRDRE